MSESEYYKRDALYMSDDTQVEEVIAYLRDVVENPILLGDDEETVVWNFSTHEFERMAVTEEIIDKDCDKFIVPYQVTGAWAFMFSLLPEDIRRSEILVYKSDKEEYYAFRNFYRTTTEERHSQLKQDLARRLEESDVPGVMK